MASFLRSAILVAAAVLAASPASAQEPPVASALMGRIARQLFELRPVPASLELPPFRAAEGGLGDCDSELRDRLIEALKLEQADPDNAIVDRRIEVRLPLARSGGGEAAARVSGRYGAERDGRLWVEARVAAPDGTVLAALPRSPVAGLACRGHRRSLGDAVAALLGGGRDEGMALSLPRTNPRVGDLVAITLRNERPEGRRPLCLNIAADDTAQVLTPLRPGAPRLAPRGQLVWPRDFAASGGPAGPICFEREQADALLCIALPDEPAALDRAWREAWPDDAAEPVELTAEATLSLVAEALAEPRASAALLRYSVGRAPPGGVSACGRSLR